MSRLLFAAMQSGSGKTAVICAFLAALQSRGLHPQAFKVGPDYIDPLFHRQVLGVPSRNLDLFLSDEAHARRLLLSHPGDVQVLEGVMGFYDGLGGTDKASTWHTAQATQTPVVLVVRPKGASLTLAAQIKGLMHFRGDSHIRGLFLNDCSEKLQTHLALLLERETGLPVLGCLPHLDAADFPSRHLGLLTAEELDGWKGRIEALGAQMEKTGNVDGLLSLAASAPKLEGRWEPSDPVANPTIAVAKDKAFCFFYEDNLDLWQALGAKLRIFSPLKDACLPEADALYLPGGYPELYARQLSQNRPMLDSIRQAVADGLPTVAECGGFLYLQKSLEDDMGQSWPMVGALPGEGKKTPRLQRFGYGKLTSPQDNLLLRAGESVLVHEFHYWDCTENGGDLVMEKASTGQSWRCGFASGRLFAGFAHLYFQEGMGRRFVEAAAQYRKEKAHGMG